MAAFAQIGVVDPYELERLAEELAGRAKGTSYRYELPTTSSRTTLTRTPPIARGEPVI